MKSLVLSTFIASALAVPSQGHTLNSRNALVHRQSAEACSLGFCLENGGTVGGGDATAVVVSDLASFKAAASKKGPSVIIVSGTITGSATDRVDISSDKTVFGEAGSLISGVALRVKGVRNVILRNLKIEKVLYEAGDAIGIDKSTNIWIDHVDLSGDLNSDKTDWDGLLDITHGSDWITVSNSYLHDHWKASLIGHADSNGVEDEGKLHVTFANNYWHQVYSRVPSVRFGVVHTVNSLFDQVFTSGINARQKSQVLVQSSAFVNGTETAVYADGSDYSGYVVLDDVDLGGSVNSAPVGSLTPDSLPYPAVELLGSSTIAATIPQTVGQIL